MILEKAIFTALPDGLDKTKRLRLSVHVAPRLTTDDGDPSPRILDEYPAFRSWAERVSQMRWHVEFDNGVSAEGIPQSKPESKLWERLFPPETFVRPHAFEDHSKKNFHVFPVREVLQFIESTYASLSAEGPELPSIDGPNALTQAFGPLAGLTNVINDNKSFWDEVGRAKAALPLSERPDGQVARDKVSGSSGRPTRCSRRTASTTGRATCGRNSTRRSTRSSSSHRRNRRTSTSTRWSRYPPTTRRWLASSGSSSTCSSSSRTRQAHLAASGTVRVRARRRPAREPGADPVDRL
jgi:hypothetical protein